MRVNPLPATAPMRTGPRVTKSWPARPACPILPASWSTVALRHSTSTSLIPASRKSRLDKEEKVIHSLAPALFTICHIRLLYCKILVEPELQRLYSPGCRYSGNKNCENTREVPIYFKNRIRITAKFLVDYNLCRTIFQLPLEL
jgi:hypothetical protein